MNVVLVHGIFDNGAIFRRLVRTLEEEGHRCWAPSLRPSDGRRGISDLAVKLKAYIESRVGTDDPIAIIGFSMGCIVARQYIQLLGGISRTKVFFAISGPHEGTLTAYLYFGQGSRDMRPQSKLLRNLKLTEGCLQDVAVFAYWTSLDAMILPASSGNWPIARHSLNARALLHRFMPSNRMVGADIVRRLRSFDSVEANNSVERVRPKAALGGSLRGSSPST